MALPEFESSCVRNENQRKKGDGNKSHIQHCPFCEKQYIYKKNYRKHLCTIHHVDENLKPIKDVAGYFSTSSKFFHLPYSTFLFSNLGILKTNLESLFLGISQLIKIVFHFFVIIIHCYLLLLYRCTPIDFIRVVIKSLLLT